MRKIFQRCFLPLVNQSCNLSQQSTKAFRSMTFYNNYLFASKTFPVPNMGDSITEGTINEIKKNPGEYVDLDEIIAIIETDKVQVEIRSPASGELVKFHAGQGSTVIVGKPLFDIETDAKRTSSAPKKEAPKQSKEAPQQQQQQVKKPQPQQQQQKSAPAQQQTKQQSSAPAQKSEAKQEAKSKTPVQPGTQLQQPSITKVRGERREQMSRMRQKIAERLKSAQSTYALLTTFQECDMGAVMDVRKKFQDDFQKKHNVKLGFMSFFIKASVLALQTQPVVNAVIDGKDVVYRDYIDISVAVATPNGLMVPVLRNCEAMRLADIEKNLITLANKGRSNKITLEDMAGGSFTISNGGVFGSMMGTPIINPPQSAILGMHSIVNRPVVRGDKIVARPMMYLALTYDHRLIDGREASTFLKQIKESIEDPTRILLDL